MLDLQILASDIKKNTTITDEVSEYLQTMISERFLVKLVKDINEHQDITRTRHMNDVLNRITTGRMQKRLQFRVRRYFKDEDVELELIYPEEEIMNELQDAGLAREITHEIYVCCSILLEHLLYYILGLAISDVEHQQTLSIENIQNVIDVV